VQVLVPGALYTAAQSDSSLNLLHKFFDMVRSKTPQVDLNVGRWSGGQSLPAGAALVVPCVVASRLGSDIEATYNRLGLAGCRSKVLLIMQHPKNTHNSDVYPTRNKTSEYDSWTCAIIDTVFWNNEVYDCNKNSTAVTEFLAAVKASGQSK
jgi:hypothetical protein